MILMMTHSIDDPVFHHRAKILRKLRRLWLRTSGKPSAAELLETIERRLSEKQRMSKEGKNLNHARPPL